MPAASQPAHGVNLSTGHVSFPITLIQANGQSGLDIEVRIVYNSSIEQQAQTWNQDRPTEILGMGWSLPQTAIIRDTHGTGSTLDDTFYLVADGASKLLQIGQDSANIYYAAENYQFWRIFYTPSAEQWTIVQEDGTMSLLGGGVTTDTTGNKQSRGSSIEWGVKWANWIGSSRQVSGQSQFALVWNLVTITRSFGQTLNLSYTQIQKPVGGPGGLHFTQASYLSAISAPGGHTATLLYASKDADEYPTPLSAPGEPDPYQQRLQTQYLSALNVQNEAGTLLYRVNLSYAFLNTGNMKKRVLISAARLTPSGRLYEPPSLFTYYGQSSEDGVSVTISDNSKRYNSSTQALYGALKTMTTSMGETTTYKYSRIQLTTTERSRKQISAPDGTWSQPRLFFGPDFTLVIWSKSNQAYLTVYQWCGTWTAYNGGALPSGGGPLQVLMSGSFFAVITPGQNQSLHLFHKDPLHFGQWIHTPQIVRLSASTKGTVGESFVALLDGTKLYRYTWNSASMTWVPPTSEGGNPLSLPFTQPAANHAIAGTHRYFLVVSTPDRTLDPHSKPEVRLYFVDANGNWQHKTETIDWFLPDPSTIHDADSVSGGSAHQLLLYASNTFVGLKAYGIYIYTLGENVYTQYNSAYLVFQWNEDFAQTTSIAHQTLFTNQSSQESVVKSETLTVIGDVLGIVSQQKKRLYRFDGQRWNSNTLSLDDATNFYGADTTLEVSRNLGTKRTSLQQYNPKNNSWDTQLAFDGVDIHFYQSLLDLLGFLVISIATAPFGFLEGYLLSTILEGLLANGTLVNGFGSVDLSGFRYMTITNSLFFQNADRSWTKLPNDLLSNTRDLKLVYDLLTLSEQFIAFMTTYQEHIPQVGIDEFRYKNFRNWIWLLRNGQVVKTLTLETAAEQQSNEASLTTEPSAEQNWLVSDTTLVAYPRQHASPCGDNYDRTSPPCASNFKDASSFNLYRVIDDDITGPLSSYTVGQVSSFDGYQTVSTYLDYEVANSVVDPITFAPVYNKVTVSSGISPQQAKRGGWNEFYFYNGSRQPLPYAPSDPAFTNANSYPAIVAGQLYHSRAYAPPPGTLPLTSARSEEQHTSTGEAISNGLPAAPPPSTVVMEQTTFWNVFQKALPAGQVSYIVRPLKVLETLDGVQKRQEYAYDLPTGINDTAFHSGVLTSERTWSHDASGQENMVQTSYLYAWQIYTDLRERNCLDQIVQTTTTHYEPSTAPAGFVESSFATTWQRWPDAVWAPRATYEWSGIGPSSFSAWHDENGPGPNWFAAIENVHLAKGIPLETRDANGTMTSSLYEKNGYFPIAQFVNASCSHFEAWYSAFEAYENLSTWRVNGDPIDTYLSIQDSFVGRACLSLPPNTAAELNGKVDSPSLSAPFLERSFVLSAYIKTEAGFAADGGTATLGLLVYNTKLAVRTTVTSPLPDTNQRWQLCEIVVDLAQVHAQNHWGAGDALSLGIEINNAKVGSSLLVDAVRLSPLDAALALYTYDASYKMPTAILDANGLALRTAYDELQREIGSCGPDEQVREATVSYLSRAGNAQQSLLAADPNSLLHLAARSGGTYYNFRGGNDGGWTGGIAVNGRLILKGNETAVLDGAYSRCGIRTQVDTGFSSLALKWKASVPDNLGQLATPLALAANGTVYATTAIGWLVAFAPNNHTAPAWSIQLETFSEGEGGNLYCKVGPDQTVYVATVLGHLCAVNPDSSRKWTYTDSNGSIYPPAIGANGMLYAPDYLSLHAINPATGTEAWTFGFPNANGSTLDLPSATIGPDGTIYAALGNLSSTPQGYLYAITPANQARWPHPFVTEGGINNPPAIAPNGTIYVTTQSGKLYAIRPDGTPAWPHPAPLPTETSRMSPVVGKQGTIYVAGGNNIYALNPDSSLKWHYVLDTSVASQLAIDADDNCYLTFDNGYTSGVFVLRSDGIPRWVAPFSVSDMRETQLAFGPILAPDGTVYANSFAGQQIVALQPGGNTVQERGVSVSLGRLSVRYQSGAYTFYEGSNQLGSPVTAPLASDWLLLGLDQSALFYANGRQIFATTSLSQAVSGSLQLGAQGDDNSGVAFHDIFVIQDPVSIASYLDGTGQLRQQQMLESASSVILSEILYDERGLPAISTVPVRKQQSAAHLPLFGFEPGLVDGRDPASGNALWDRSLTNPRHGVMSGSIQQWLDPQFKTNYPYVESAYENNPLERLAQVTAPDQNFIYGAGHAQKYGYGLNPTAQSFLQALGILPDKWSKYLVNTRSLPLSNTERITSISVQNTQGQRVLEGAQDQRYLRLFSAADSFRPVSQRPDIGFSQTLFYPNYYTLGSAGMASKALEQYDRRNLLVQQTTPDALAGTSYIYDKTGQLRFMLDADGAAEHTQRILYAKYDRLGRLTESGYLSMNWNQQALQEYAHTLPDWPPTGTPLKQYSYDQNPDGKSSNAKGRLVQVITHSGLQDGGATSTKTALTYDRAGNVSSYSVSIPGYDSQVHLTAYTYDATGNITSITYPTLTPDQPALAVTYTYDLLGRIVGIGKPGNDGVFGSYSYNPDGSLRQECLNGQADSPTKTLRTYTYNSLGWLTSISDPLFMTEQLSYQDEQGNYLSGDITSTNFTFQPSVRVGEKQAVNYTYRYRYDAFHQLVQAQHSSDPSLNLTIGQLENGRIVNGYDANGNILRWQQGSEVRTYRYTSGTNQVSSVSTGQAAHNFTYTPGGAVQTTPTLAAISYDPLLRRSLMAHKADGQARVLYLYGSNSERALKMVQHKDQQGDWQTTKKTLFLYGTGDFPLLEASMSSTGQIQQMLYVYGPGGLLAMSDGTTEYFVLRDHLNSTRIVFNAANEVVAFFNYTPFGELLEGNSTVDGGAQRFPYRYTGQQYDFDLGLYNYRARLYDSTLGRFYAPDPAHQFSSPYAYVGNSPLSRTDPTGEVWLPSGRAIARLATAAGSYLAYSVYQGLSRSGSGRLFSMAAAAATFAGALSLGRYLIRRRARSLLSVSKPLEEVGNAEHPLIIYTANDNQMALRAFLLANWRGIDPNNVVPYGTWLGFRRYNRHIILLMHGEVNPPHPARNGRHIFADNTPNTLPLTGWELGENLNNLMDVFQRARNDEWFIENLSCYGGRRGAVSHRLQRYLRRQGFSVVVKGGQNALTIYNLGAYFPIAGVTGTRLTLGNWKRLEEFLNILGVTNQWNFNYYPRGRTPGLLASLFLDKPV